MNGKVDYKNEEVRQSCRIVMNRLSEIQYYLDHINYLSEILDDELVYEANHISKLIGEFNEEIADKLVIE